MNNIVKLAEELKKRQDQDGVKCIRLFRASDRTSMDRLAKSTLDLLQADTVTDNDIF